MLIFTHRLSSPAQRQPYLTLSLSAEERTRSRYRFDVDGQILLLRLPRGTILHDGDLIESETGEIVEIVAKPELVMTATAKSSLELLQAAYHLGNRHVPLELTPAYLRFSADPVLKQMLHQLGVEVSEETVPFHPEAGAYGHRHSSS